MLDIKFILENVDVVKNAVKVKNLKVDIDLLVDLYNKIKVFKQEKEDASALKNKLSKEIPAMSGDAKNEAVLKSKEAGEIVKIKGAELEKLEPVYQNLLLSVPQIPAADVPVGKSDEDNVVIIKVGEPRKFDFEPLGHCDLLDKNNWWFSGISQISGPRTYCLRGEAAELEMALKQYVINKLIGKGFVFFNVPSLVKKEAIMDAGHFPGSDESVMDSDVFQLADDGKCLAGTSEIVINSLHKDQILNENDLPLLYAGYNSCFRKEAGAAGKDTRGLIRVHQFHKVEQFVFCKPEDTIKMHKFLLNNLEEVMKDLELPYQVIEACTGDMGFNKIKLNDVEAWIPSENKYREMGSCSSIGEFQARRTMTRYRENATGEVRYCHTLNNTGIALPRPIVAILENHQTKDGKVRIPEKLRPYMNGKEFIG